MSPAYSASCVYSTWSVSKPKARALLADGLAHGGRAKLVDLGRQQGAPARLAIARLLHQHDARAELEHRREFHRAIGEGEELDIELFRHLAQKVVDAHGAAVRQRKGKVRREHGDAAAAGGAGAAFDYAMAGGNDGVLAPLPGPPARAQVDAVERHAAPEEQRGQVEAQMMALQAGVVRQDLMRGQPVSGAPQRAGLAGEHHRRQADAVGLQFAAQFRPVLFGSDEVAAVGNQRAHLFGHAAAEFGIAGAEGDDDRFGTFAEQAEDPLLHRVDLVNQSTAQAISGVNDTTAITGV